MLMSSLLSYTQDGKLSFEGIKKGIIKGKYFNFTNNTTAKWVYCNKRTGEETEVDTVSLYLFKNNKIKLKNEVIKIANQGIGFYYFGDSILYMFDHLSKQRVLKTNKINLKSVKEKTYSTPFFNPKKYFADLLLAKEYIATDTTYRFTYKKHNREIEFTKCYVFSKKDTSLISVESHLKPRVNYLSEIYESYTFLGFRKDIKSLRPLDVLPKNLKQVASEKVVSQNQQYLSPDIKYATMEGDSIYLSSIKSEYYLLDLWYIGCVPCMKALPELHKLTEKYPYVKLISINTHNKALREVPDFVKKSGNKNLSLSQTKEFRLFTSSYPTFMLLDKDLKILHIQSGFNKQQMKDLEKIIQGLRK